MPSVLGVSFRWECRGRKRRKGCTDGRGAVIRVAPGSRSNDCGRLCATESEVYGFVWPCICYGFYEEQRGYVLGAYLKEWILLLYTVRYRMFSSTSL